MVRLLIRVAIFLATAALGLFVASLLLPDFKLSTSGFIMAVVVFAISQTILTPFMFKMAKRYAAALVGGVGLISTYIALLIATVVADGLQISGFRTWILATLVVWIVTAFGAWLLPLIAFKKTKKGS